MPDVHGILLLDKPLGLSSAGAVARVKCLFNARKAGHTGSLDPLASGMLPICFGEATKFGALMLDADKTYRVTVRLGERTPSADLRIGGDRAARAAAPVQRRSWSDALARVSARLFAGSAHAFGPQAGRQAAVRVRAGGRDARARRAPIVIHDMRLIDWQSPGSVLRCALHERGLHPRAGRGSGGAARHHRSFDRACAGWRGALCRCSRSGPSRPWTRMSPGGALGAAAAGRCGARASGGGSICRPRGARPFARVRASRCRERRRETCASMRRASDFWAWGRSSRPAGWCRCGLFQRRRIELESECVRRVQCAPS